MNQAVRHIIGCINVHIAHLPNDEPTIYFLYANRLIQF